jgi:hypothetical protein
MLDLYFEGDEARRPTARIVEIEDPKNEVEARAIRDFTYPCTRCVPGARESWNLFPIDFEDPYEYDEVEDDDE